MQRVMACCDTGNVLVYSMLLVYTTLIVYYQDIVSNTL